MPRPDPSPDRTQGVRSWRRRPVLFSGVLAVAVLALGLTAASGALRGDSRSASADSAVTAAQATATQFLAGWTDPDGRVVRRDQGGDTVSEGQAYGLLLAVATDDQARFSTIWNWTRQHLQQPDGLLAWRWDKGAVLDEQSAADADVDTAWALLLAGRRFHEAADTAAGTALANAILTHETEPVSSGRVLLAGPWADGNPLTLDPSYLVAGQADALATATGNTGWKAVAAGTRAVDERLVTATTLPPDWATLSSTGGDGNGSVARASSVVPAAAPNGGAGPEYGLDAPRLLVRLAASCNANDRALAVRADPVLGGPGQPALRSLTGASEVSWQHPLSDVADAAVEHARGDTAATRTDLADAATLQRRTPTYYGAAWVALGQVLLTTSLLSDCPAA